MSYEDAKSSAIQNERNLAAQGWPIETTHGTQVVSGEKIIDGRRYLVVSGTSSLLEWSVEEQSWTLSAFEIDAETLPDDVPADEEPPDFTGDVAATDLAEVDQMVAETQTAAPEEPQEEE